MIVLLCRPYDRLPGSRRAPFLTHEDRGISVKTAGIFFILIAVVLYVLPSIVALVRGRQSASVLVINIFLGWTLVGWVVALALAVSTNHGSQNVQVHPGAAAPPPPIGPGGPQQWHPQGPVPAAEQCAVGAAEPVPPPAVLAGAARAGQSPGRPAVPAPVRRAVPASLNRRPRRQSRPEPHQVRRQGAGSGLRSWRDQVRHADGPSTGRAGAGGDAAQQR
ncbi:superinfection immunity protein [Candidatus Frankia nodulisporulans]|uniref:superinfection immunity protein n=1 Tax=Candidatus Frankia nodulisporulans TaxID=2060052 RepID=UPI0013D3A7A7